MNDDRDARLKATLDGIVARTPDLGPTPSPELLSVADHHRGRRRVVLAAAASVVAVGVAGLAWAATGDHDPAAPAAAPTPSSEANAATTHAQDSVPASIPTLVVPTAPTASEVPSGEDLRGGPTLFPMLNPAAVSDAPITGNLNYVGTRVEPQTNAVVAHFDEDGATADLYTFVVGDGVSGYTNGLGLSVDASTPQLADVGGFGYASWTTNETPVLVMASDPTVLLDDPAFSMYVTSSGDGAATIEFESLPEGFDALVEPRRFAREAATAQLTTGSASVFTSLDNPLTNLNLTEGSTITPTSPIQLGGGDTWIVSFPDSDNRAVVWSPDGTTWVSVHWSGSEEELLTFARAVAFTDDAGEWMNTYGVDLPPIYFDTTTASG